MNEMLGILLLLLTVSHKLSAESALSSVLPGSAQQSSTSSGGAADRAVDGNRSGAWIDKSCTATAGTDPVAPWWTVYLEELTEVHSVILSNRDTSTDRLKDFTITVDGQVCVENQPTFEGTKRFPCDKPLTGRTVKITLADPGTLTLCEVEIYGNVVSSGISRSPVIRSSAQQSSTTHNADADRAVDGNRSGNWGDNSCTHTGDRDTPWWTVELQELTEVHSVILFNRVDTGSDRLKDFTITVDGQVCVENQPTFKGTKRFPCDKPLTGRTVKITLANPGTLTLCEVEIYGQFGFTITVDDQVCVENHASFTGTETISCSEPVKGQTVRIALKPQGELSLCQVDVLTTDAAGVPINPITALQSSTDGDFVPGTSLDDNTETCAKTSYELDPWWQVDLTQDTEVHSLTIVHQQYQTEAASWVVEMKLVPLVTSTVRQKSTKTSSNRDFAAGLAVDGIFGIGWSQCAQTEDRGRDPWWAVEFEKEAEVYSVSILNQNVSSNHLKDIHVDGKVCATNQTNVALYKTIVCDAPVRGKKLNISMTSSSRRSLVLCEVRVHQKALVPKIETSHDVEYADEYLIDELTNLGMTPVLVPLDVSSVQQDSTGYGRKASLAVDGEWSARASDCTQTGRESYPWWAVDMKEETVVHSVTILVPYSTPDETYDRLREFTITVDDHICVMLEPGWNEGQRTIVCDEPVRGKTLNISMASRVLKLCEVQIHRLDSPEEVFVDTIRELAADLRPALKETQRQVMDIQLGVEQRTRANGMSGIKQSRVGFGGDKPYFRESYKGSRFAAMHDHKEFDRTMGLGEFEAILNGVEFVTRHNDYKLEMPKNGSATFRDVEDIPFPDVPERVLNNATVDGQVEEMKKYFAAWYNDTNKSEHPDKINYRPYFTPVLVYLEGWWTASGVAITDFHSDRHKNNGKTWSDMWQKFRFTATAGRKGAAENIAYLPSKLYHENGCTDPANASVNDVKLAQWNYRLVGWPLPYDENNPDEYISLEKFRLIEDDMAETITKKYKIQTRGRWNLLSSRFQLNPDNKDWTDSWEERKEEKADFLDKIFSKIPGMSNDVEPLYDDAFDVSTHSAVNGEKLNAAKYHRKYNKTDDGKTDDRERFRFWNDDQLFMAMNNHPNVAKICINNQCKTCEEKCLCQRWSYAVPVEIVYMTPLSKWNPYNVTIRPHKEKAKVTANGRDGKFNSSIETNSTINWENAYNGTDSTHYYLTPSEFFEVVDENGDVASTGSKFVGVLDQSNTVRKMGASGHSLSINVGGLGKIRRRFPIMPVHIEGGGLGKELRALQEIVLKPKTNAWAFKEEL